MKKTLLYGIAAMVAVALSFGSCTDNNQPNNPNDKEQNDNNDNQGGGGNDTEEIKIPEFRNAKWTELHQTMIDKGWKLTTFMPEPTEDYTVSKIEWKAADKWDHGWILVYSPDLGFIKKYFTQLMKESADGWKEFDKMQDDEGNKVDAFSNEVDYIVTYVDENSVSNVIGIYYYGDIKK